LYRSSVPESFSLSEYKNNHQAISQCETDSRVSSFEGARTGKNTVTFAAMHFSWNADKSATSWRFGKGWLPLYC
jgi:hypothetical protein